MVVPHTGPFFDVKANFLRLCRMIDLMTSFAAKRSYRGAEAVMSQKSAIGDDSQLEWVFDKPKNNDKDGNCIEKFDHDEGLMKNG